MRGLNAVEIFDGEGDGAVEARIRPFPLQRRNDVADIHSNNGSVDLRTELGHPSFGNKALNDADNTF